MLMYGQQKMLEWQIMQVLKKTRQFHKCAFQAPLHKQVSNKLYSNPSGVPICIKILLFCQRTFLCQLSFMCELKRPPRAFYILSHGCLEGISRLMTFCLWMISDFQRVPICHSFYLVMIWWNQVNLQGFLQGLPILLWSANTEERCPWNASELRRHQLLHMFLWHCLYICCWTKPSA